MMTSRRKPARATRGRGDWPAVGLFAQHGRMRPDRIGVSLCRLPGVEGTPVLDIKPAGTGYLPRGEIREPGWAKELMAEYE